jgi:hypothetical protein
VAKGTGGSKRYVYVSFFDNISDVLRLLACVCEGSPALFLCGGVLFSSVVCPGFVVFDGK